MGARSSLTHRGMNGWRAWVSYENAHVERFNQTVMSRARAAMLQSNLPVSYLPNAIDMAIDEHNLLELDQRSYSTQIWVELCSMQHTCFTKH